LSWEKEFELDSAHLSVIFHSKPPTQVLQLSYILSLTF